MSNDHDIHSGHDHVHGPGCGHTGVRHDDHVDYLHDGHLHHPHGDHVDEHRLPIDATHPTGHTTPIEHPDRHVHGHGCGHDAVPHDEHVDYLVDGRLHHPHGEHCDDHGVVEVL